MGNKKKGIAAERELFHLLWDREFAVVRVAGSGCMPEPSCDLLAGNGEQSYAIEVKTSRDKRRYITKEQMTDFVHFAKKFGVQPILAFKFLRTEWLFVKPEHLEDTGKNFAISIEKAKELNLRII
ncbi:MAG: Holliday junction resolvase Hjc [Candidatus Pacearchaeota archaeon]|nr:Holliday junction resolvase Hjc [Candidatus Pacearchaeota archaeon]